MDNKYEVLGSGPMTNRPIWNNARRINHANRFYSHNSGKRSFGTARPHTAVPSSSPKQDGTIKPDTTVPSISQKQDDTAKCTLAVPTSSPRKIRTARPYTQRNFHNSRDNVRSTNTHPRRHFHRSPSHHRIHVPSPKASENGSADTASKKLVDYSWRPKPTTVNQISPDKKWISVMVNYQDSQERPKSVLAWVLNDN